MIMIKVDGNVRLVLSKKTEKGVIVENKNKNIQREISYILPKREDYSPERYVVNILFHKDLPENYIFQVYEKSINQRIGWIFPLQALISNKHSYANDEHFLRIAYPAFINLITSEETIPHKIPSLKEDLSLEDFYSSNSVVLILDKEELIKIDSFNIEDYIPNFYQYGYYFLKPNMIKLNDKILDEFLEDTNSKSIRKKITISPISKKLKNDKFIYQLFKNMLSNEEHPVIRFYLFYQIIELLIKSVFDDQFKKKIHFIDLEKLDLFDLNKTLQEMTWEKKRINLLLNEYTQVKSPELEELFSDFLQLNEKDKKLYNLADLLYKVRIFLVHNYRHLKPNQKNLIEDINFYFERMVISLLINYRED